MTNDEILADPCPNCGTVGQIHFLKRDEEVKVRGQRFTVHAEYFKCAACESDFESLSGVDSLDAAYRLYRTGNGLLQPESLKTWRQSLSLKQSELAGLLGWSTATVSRYENGALQDDAHDRAMRAAMTPDGLAELVEAAHGLDAKTLESLRKSVDEMLGSASKLRSVVSHRLSNSASRSVNWRKLTEAVLFFSQGRGVARTKLNKLLFYTDFLHAKHYGPAVTGMSYVRMQHGPVPQEYELIYSAMSAEGLLNISETLFGDHVGYVHCGTRGPEVGVFETTEMQALVKVQAEFERTSAKDISDRSHTEEGWIKTPSGHHVSLAFAKSLSLAL